MIEWGKTAFSTAGGSNPSAEFIIPAAGGMTNPAEEMAFKKKKSLNLKYKLFD